MPHYYSLQLWPFTGLSSLGYSKGALTPSVGHALHTIHSHSQAVIEIGLFFERVIYLACRHRPTYEIKSILPSDLP